MGTPVRTSILLDIKSTLESISVANGQKTDVVKVDPFLRTRDDVKPGERPYVAFGPGSTPFTHDLFETMRGQMDWTAVGYIDENDWTLASAAINDLRDDIIAVIMEDTTLGGTSTQTLLVRDLTDEADPDRATIPVDGAAVVLEFRTTYYRDTGSS